MRVRFTIAAGVFNGQLRWYVWDEEAKARITEPTTNRSHASGESLKRVSK